MYKTKRYQDFTLANGEEVELETGYTPADWKEPTIVEVGNYIVFGYLSHDDDCGNPLEDCDAMGVIHHHPRSRYGRRDSDYYDILGLDQYGDQNLETILDLHFGEAAARYIEVVIRDVDCGTLLEWADSEYERVEEDEYASDTVFIRNCLRADLEAHDFNCQHYETLNTVLRDMFEDERFFPGDKDAVLLDLYDHSGCIWSISGTGMNCRWDTSRGESVWVPDKELRKYLDEIADPKERRARAVEYAEQAVEQYNAWSSGDCYGVVVQVHEKDGTLVEKDECWGYIGGDYAEESLAEQVKWAVARYEDKAPPKNPNQMEMSI